MDGAGYGIGDVQAPHWDFPFERRTSFPFIPPRYVWQAILVGDCVGVMLFFLGFLADGSWPITYLQSLFRFRDVSQCQLCVSMPLTIAQLGGVGFDQSIWIAGLLLLTWIALFLGSRYRSGDALFVAFFVCVALLVNPYLQNYDFAFALVPLFYLIGSARSRWDWLWIGLVFFLPWIGLGFFERQGNSALLVSTVVMALIILTRMYKKHTITS
jgi:hypothetical protein